MLAGSNGLQQEEIVCLRCANHAPRQVNHVKLTGEPTHEDRD